MQFVCPDDDGDWYYLPDAKAYKRMKDGLVRGAISGRHIPDPHALLKARRNIHPQARPPTEATYKLWEHWNAQQ